GGGGHRQGGPQPGGASGWVRNPARACAQHDVWGLPPCPPPYDLAPQPEGEAGARVESNSEGASPDHGAAPLRSHEAGQGETAKDPEQFAKLLKQKQITLGCTQTSVGLTLGVLFEKFQRTRLSCGLKLRPLLQKWVEETDNSKICRRYARERPCVQNRVRGSLESLSLQCPKPSLQHIGHFAQQLGLKDKGKQSSRDYFQREDFEAAGSPFSGGPVSIPLTPGPHFGTPGFGGPHVSTLYPYVPVPEAEAFPSVSVTALGSPVPSDRGACSPQEWGVGGEEGRARERTLRFVPGLWD
ncbi:hypothetical protein FD755_001816, partial [Muntiacus reevesi]